MIDEAKIGWCRLVGEKERSVGLHEDWILSGEAGKVQKSKPPAFLFPLNKILNPQGFKKSYFNLC